MIFNFMLPDEVIEDCLLGSMDNKELVSRIFNGIFLKGLQETFPTSEQLHEFICNEENISIMKDAVYGLLEIATSGVITLSDLLNGLSGDE